MLDRKLLPLLSLLTLLSGIFLVTGHTAVIRFTEGLLNNPLDPGFWSTGLNHAGIELVLIAANLLAFFLYLEKFPDLTLKASALAWTGIFIFYVLKNTVNVPFHDDYFFLEFLVSYTKTGDLSEVFNQCNESRQILMKGLSLILYWLGAFNIKTLVIIPLFCLIGSSLMLFYSSRLEGRNKMLLILLLTIILFQFQYYDAVVWASGALYNSCTLFFALTSLFLLFSRLKYRSLIALVSALLCVASNGVGFILLAVCSGILILQKRRAEIVVWNIVFLTVLALYFTNYSLAKDNYDGIGTDPETIPGKILSCLLFSPVFLGSSLQFLYQAFLPFILGLGIWGTFVYATYKKYYLQNSVIYSLLVFILLVSFVPPAARNNLALIEGINIRYGIYSVFALCCCLIFWSEMIPAMKFNRLLIFLFPAGIIFHLLTGIFFYPEAVLRKEVALHMARNFKRTNLTALPAPYKQGPANAAYLFKYCSENNIYELPQE